MKKRATKLCVYVVGFYEMKFVVLVKVVWGERWKYAREDEVVVEYWLDITLSPCCAALIWYQYRGEKSSIYS